MKWRCGGRSRVDPDKIIPIGLFVTGETYKLWGLFESNLHFIGPINPADTVYFLGSDRIGRDLFSRLIYGTRISMSIGLVGVVISLALGVFLGGISGYYGGAIDTAIQRLVEVVSAMPTIPLWMGLAAAIPLAWPPALVYFTVTAIVSLLGWTSLAREVRGRFFALREEDFVTAARLDGSSEMRLIFRHMLPSITSHLLAMVTLAVPAMIIAETSLSFLGIGLKPPVVSWGVLLQDAQNIRAIANAPWLLFWPALAVMVSVLASTSSATACATRRTPMTTESPMIAAPHRARSAAISRSSSRCAAASSPPPRDVGFKLRQGRTLCLVGESGSGKSVTARAMMQLIDAPGRIARGNIVLGGGEAAVDIATLNPRGEAIRAIRGRRIGMIFQEPMSSLSPGAHHRLADHRGAAAAPQDGPAAGPGPHHRTAAAG